MLCPSMLYCAEAIARSTRFFGTDFTFEDLQEWDVDQYDHKLLGEEDLDGVKFWRIEGIKLQFNLPLNEEDLTVTGMQHDR
jgi:hypothetical protein